MAQTAETSETRNQTRATAAEMKSDACSDITDIINYLKQITHHFVYALTIMEGIKPIEECGYIRQNLNKMLSCLLPVFLTRRLGVV